MTHLHFAGPFVKAREMGIKGKNRSYSEGIIEMGMIEVF